MPLHLIWTMNGVQLRGMSDGVWNDGSLLHGVSHPGRVSASRDIRLQSSARADHTFEKLTGVRLYLDGTDEELQIVQEVWPALGGGIEISFNDGRSYQLFSTVVGYKSNPNTWLLLPAEAAGLNGQDGVLGPFDSAHMFLRYRVPAESNDFRLYQVRLEADFDVV